MKFKTSAFFNLTALLFCLFSLYPQAWGREGGEVRTANPLGVAVGIMDPFPSLLGIHVGFNFMESIRLSVGYGKAGSTDGSLSTIAGGLKLLLPKWDISPFASLYIAKVDHQGTNSLLDIRSDMQVFYSSFGFDIQMTSGFNIGIAYNIAWTGGIKALPSGYIGYYFNPSSLF